MIQDRPAFTETVQRDRTCGKVTVFFSPRSEFTQRNVDDLLDAFVAKVGFSGVKSQYNEAWCAVDEQVARSLVSQLLQRDMAYQCSIMDESRADLLVDAFLAFFSNARYYSNTDSYTPRSGWSWSPIADSTFDSGIIAIDETDLGMIWFQDED